MVVEGLSLAAGYLPEWGSFPGWVLLGLGRGVGVNLPGIVYLLISGFPYIPNITTGGILVHYPCLLDFLDMHD